jgi:hypothetical protein
VAASLAGGSSRAAPSTTAWNSNWFQSPTGNIRCRYFVSSRLLACTTLNNGRMLGVTLTGTPFARRSFGYSFPGGPVLSYGDWWSVRGKFRCDSRSTGMTCKSLQTRFGFFINRTSYRFF